MSYIRENAIDEVYVTVPWQQAPEFYRKNQALRNLSTNVYIVPVDDDLSRGLVGARCNGDRLQIHVVDRPLDGWARVGKRMLDCRPRGHGCCRSRSADGFGGPRHQAR